MTTNDVNASFIIIDGICWVTNWDAETLRSALNYQTRTNDLYIVAYQRSGTNWMTTIVYTLQNNGQPFDKDSNDYFRRTRCLEFTGEEEIVSMPQPCIIKCHLPMDRIAFNPQAKYICVIRNPKDVCVSYYKFYNTWAGTPRLEFTDFFEYFINGNLPLYDYFQSLRMVWQRRHEPNVFVVAYEEMKDDIRLVIKKLAVFLGIDLTAELLEKVVQYSSINYMKEKYDDERRLFNARCIEKTNDKVQAARMREVFDGEINMRLIGKGDVNGWKNYMTPEQAQRINDRFLEICHDCNGLQEYWSKWNVF